MTGSNATEPPSSGLANGAFILAGDPDTTPDHPDRDRQRSLPRRVCLEPLSTDGINARVVSMPAMEQFDRQDQTYRDHVLPPAVTARVVIEQGSAFGWERWVESSGEVIAMRTFGASRR